MVASVALALALAAGEPLRSAAWSADEGCSRLSLGGPQRNDHYLAPPPAGADYAAWLEGLRRWREQVVRGDDQRDAAIAMAYDGVRAWARASRAASWAADLAPGETITVRGEAQWIEGGDQLGLAFDLLDRASVDAAWRDWSTVLGSARLAHHAEWQPFAITVIVPEFDRAQRWVRPILGLDESLTRQRGRMNLRGLTLEVPSSPERAARWPAEESRALDLSQYDRPDLAWAARNFVCGFQMMVDRAFWDPDRGYQIDALCDQAEREFGGWDSVVLWHAYPRIGVDDRNQFDFWRHMPGGMAGLRGVVDSFHRRGVKVFLPYKPWDQGTRREGRSDELVLAEIVAAIDADGLFLDTIAGAPTALRAALDAARPGVVLEPELHPATADLEFCGSSWAQWLAEWPGVGVLRHRWIEPRHMQHQIRRWDRQHRGELAAAWLNGSGIMVWENVFGSYNPWPAQDRADLRRMAPILRGQSDLLLHGEWLPCYPAGRALASVWRGPARTFIALASPDGQPLTAELALPDRGERWTDLWTGAEVTVERAAGQVRLRVAVERFGALVGSLPGDAPLPPTRVLPAMDAHHGETRSVVEPLPPPRVDPSPLTAGMLAVPSGWHLFTVTHLRRECGCYPDADTPPERWPDFLSGQPWDGQLTHQQRVNVAPGHIDPAPVTNGQFERFLADSGWRPKQPERFLAHWAGTACPPALRAEPVVYVDLDDARAYAAWAGRRLPTEWEWQAAAADPAFERGRVWEWTESERDDGHTRFVMLRGGSSYVPAGSGWYFPSGPQPVGSHAKFLRMWPGLDRCATVGFRCVRPD